MATSEAIGIEIGRVWKAGKYLLPQAADDVHTAWLYTPTSASAHSARGAGLGKDPGAKLNEMLNLMNRALSDTEDALRDVGQALVWTAEDFEFRDQEAKQAFENEKKKI